MEKDILKVLVSEEQIQARIREMGEEISREYAGKDPVILGVLKGVVVFYADMVRHITVPCQMDFMCPARWTLCACPLTRAPSPPAI